MKCVSAVKRWSSVGSVRSSTVGQDSKIAQVYRGIAMLKMIGDAWILSARLGGRK